MIVCSKHPSAAEAHKTEKQLHICGMKLNKDQNNLEGKLYYGQMQA